MTEPTQTPYAKEKNLVVAMDTDGWMLRTFSSPTRAEGCFFILCLEGECTFHIHLSDHSVKANNLVCILPKTYFHLTDRSEDCRLYVLEFNNRIIDTASFITSSMTYLSSLLNNPVAAVDPAWTDIYTDYFRVLEKTSRLTDFHDVPDVASHLLLSIIQGVIHIHQHSTTEINIPGNRSEEIIRQLIQQVMLHYTHQRSVSFYADQLHVSPQHLSSVVNKVTGRTVTDIIARLVVSDAQAKLKSTHMSVQEIAFSLNFADISFFGKYFKRYTGMSPKTYRES